MPDIHHRAATAVVVLTLVAAGTATAQSATTELFVDPLFSDHMVLQQGKSVRLRGQAAPDEAVTVTIAGQSLSARADGQGRWNVALPALPGATHTDLVVTTASGQTRTIADVVAGDVFLCSGQSNMDLPVSDSAYPKRTALEGEGLPIRVFKVKRTAQPAPQPWITPEIAWAPAGPDSLPAFSAACWHTARKISSAQSGVTLGLVQASWGGTSIEDWMPGEALAKVPGRAGDLARLAAFNRDPAATTAATLAETDSWLATVDPGSAPGRGYERPALDDSAWPLAHLPGSWERSGIEAVRSFDGVMWYRRTVELTAAQARAGATLKLGRIDERDRVWINGQTVGASLLSTDVRSYAIGDGVLQPGRNVIAIRVVDERGGGGLMSTADDDLRLDFGDGTRLPLAGDWRYQPSQLRRTWSQEPPFVSWAAPRGVTMLWNAMVAPLDGFAVKSIIWYQGESNAAEANAYGDLLRQWRSSWRGLFRDPALPVVIAQLPGYGPRAAAPGDNDWARLREVQRQVAAEDPATGLAVLIDLGVSYDIHPAHKDEAGARLGNEVLRVAYQQPILPAPSPISAMATAEGVVVTFRDTGGALTAFGSHDAAGFELCAGDGRCRFVAARVAGDSVVLPAADEAVEVRYAWQGSPPVNLYGRSGLPVVPFRLDIAR